MKKQARTTTPRKTAATTNKGKQQYAATIKQHQQTTTSINQQQSAVTTNKLPLVAIVRSLPLGDAGLWLYCRLLSLFFRHTTHNEQHTTQSEHQRSDNNDNNKQRRTMTAKPTTTNIHTYTHIHTEQNNTYRVTETSSFIFFKASRAARRIGNCEEGERASNLLMRECNSMALQNNNLCMQWQFVCSPDWWTAADTARWNAKSEKGWHMETHRNTKKHTCLFIFLSVPMFVMPVYL